MPAQLPLIASVGIKRLRERRSRPRPRRYPEIPSSYLQEMTKLWMIVTGSKSVDYSRAARAWAEAWTAYVLRNHEDPLRFSLDIAGCLETLWEHKSRGVRWLEAMTYETVPKMLERYRSGLFRDDTAQALERILRGEGEPI